MTDNFNNQPTHRRERFSFDEFDDKCQATIESEERWVEDAKLCLQGIELELAERWPEPDVRPGQIGGVIATPLYREWFGDEVPPDAA